MSGRGCASGGGKPAWVLVAAILVSACGGGSQSLFVTSEGSASTPAAASTPIDGFGVTLPVPEGWFAASAVGTLVVAELEGDLASPTPHGARLVVERSSQGVVVAATIDVPLVTGEDEGAGILAVTEEPREVTIDGARGVSIEVEEGAGSARVVRRVVVVPTGGPDVLGFSLEAPAARWPEARGALEGVLAGATIDAEPGEPAPATTAGTTTTIVAEEPSAASRIAFMTDRDGNWDVFVMDANGSNQTALIASPEWDGGAAWSPDGSKIAFGSERDGDREIYVMDADGSNLVRLTTSPGYDISPAWSPDGSKIAFMSERDGDREIYVMDADGSDPVRLTDSPGNDAGPVWSPDGLRIAFMSDRDGDHDIFVMNADGSDPVRLTDSPGEDTSPAWSPDGSRIAFGSDREGDTEVYVMDADGSGLIRLTASPGEDSLPAWSPDGSRIAFTSERSGNWDIYVMEADGSNPAQLTTSPALDVETAWSP